MKNYLEKPNIPQKQAKGVIVDFRTADEAVCELEKLGITVLKTKNIATLYSAVSGHADMQIHHLGKNKFVTAPEVYEYYKKKLTNAEVICGAKELGREYPTDVAYNAASVGEALICREAHTADEIKANYKRILDVKQGYAKCSVCIINENAIITADRGIQKTALKSGMDVLLINEGYIELESMSYGFIGGATGLISKDALAVNGDLKTHPDYEKIRAFAMNYGVSIISLKKGVIYDIGSVLPIL